MNIIANDDTLRAHEAIPRRLPVAREHREPPVEIAQGQVLSLKGGVKLTFKNAGQMTATIVEVFGKAPKP